MDIERDDIIRIVRRTHSVVASRHLLRVVRTDPNRLLVYAAYLSENDLYFGKSVYKDESTTGLVLDENCVEKI